MAENRSLMLQGLCLVLTAAVFFSFSMFALLGAKLLPPSGNPLVDFLREDKHYSALLPLALPTTLIAVYVSWVGLKLFRHN